MNYVNKRKYECYILSAFAESLSVNDYVYFVRTSLHTVAHALGGGMFLLLQ